MSSSQSKRRATFTANLVGNKTESPKASKKKDIPECFRKWATTEIRKHEVIKEESSSSLSSPDQKPSMLFENNPSVSPKTQRNHSQRDI